MITLNQLSKMIYSPYVFQLDLLNDKDLVEFDGHNVSYPSLRYGLAPFYKENR